MAGPVGDTLSARVSVAGQETGSFRDFQADGGRVFFAPTLAWRPSTKTRADVDYDYTYQTSPGDRGLVVVGNTVARPVGRSYGEPWSKNYGRSNTIRGRIEHDVADWLTLRQIVSHQAGGRALANHPPALVVNGRDGRDPVPLTAAGGDSVILDATGSCDPDGGALHYRWWTYPEPSGVRGLAPLAISGAETARATLVAPAAADRAITYHIILEASDGGAPAITRYRRILLTVPAAKPVTERR